MRSGTTLAIIVPVYNEQYLVESSLRRLVALGESDLLERIQVVVVDDGSSDRTPAVLDRFRRSLEDFGGGKFEWLFLQHEVNRGKAAAIRTGLAHANTELCAIHDADLEYHPLDLLKMVQVFFAEEADAVFGSRFMASQYRRVLFFRHELGNRFLTLLSNLVSDLNLTDMETCYKMVRTKLLQSIPLVSERFGIEPEITIKLAKRGARIFEVPIRYAGRTYQEGKKIGWKDGVKTLGVIARFAVSDRVYQGPDGAGHMTARLRRAPRFTRWMADLIRPYVGESVLEIGAGTGNLTLQLLPRTLYWASDANPLYLDYLDTLTQTRPYLHVGYTDGQRPQSYPRDQKFETVVGLNVVEHVTDDLAALQNIREALLPGGRAIVLVPAGPRLFGSLDEALGHRRRYTRQQLTSLAEQAGFTVEAVLPFNRPGVIGWWINGSLLRRTSLGLWQIKLLNCLTPAFRRMDPWLPLPPLSWIAVLGNPLSVSATTGSSWQAENERTALAGQR
jgi:SAM-dependent methyltransferase